MEFDIPDIYATCKVDVIVDVEGTPTDGPNGSYHPAGSQIRLTATPKPGRVFLQWQGHVPGDQTTENPLTLVMDNDRTVTAVFATPLAVAAMAEPDLVPAGAPCRLTANPTGGAAPYVCRWCTGQIGASVTVMPDDTTVYSVTAEDALGQTAQANVEVRVASGLVVSAEARPEVVAPGTTVTLTATASGGSTPYVYRWSDGQAMQTITVTPVRTSTYAVTATDALGQSAQDTVQVVVSPALGVVLRAEPGSISYGQTSRLAAESTGGLPPYAYQWSTGQTAETISAAPLAATTYSVAAIDSLGQVATSEITVTVTCDLTLTTVGPGFVRQDPSGLTTFEAGRTVTLTAIPDQPGDRFLGWQGDAASGDAEIRVVMDRHKRISAVFEETQAVSGENPVGSGSCAAPGIAQIALMTVTFLWFVRPSERPKPR
ncbi:MAG: hypothetical protein JXQ73_07590 [Phycisphaerae bacterium]|nr:hypothetical protein [Phycisphaerae bacterium]